MRSVILLAVLGVAFVGCDTTTTPPVSSSPTAFQVRTTGPDGVRLTERFTRDETTVSVQILGSECTGASVYQVTARNAEGRSSRFTFNLPGDGSLPVVSTRPLSLNDGIASTLRYTGPVTLDSEEVTTDFVINRSIVAIENTAPPNISGAIQVFGARGDIDMDATVSFNVPPEFVFCQNAAPTPEASLVR